MCYAHYDKRFIHQSNYKKTYALFAARECTAHTAKNSKHYLQNAFSDRIIGRGLWLPRSPLLKPLDFFNCANFMR